MVEYFDQAKGDSVLIRWLKVNFGETFVAWIHVKALRVFVESVLRYGLPVNFLAVVIQPNKKSVIEITDEQHKYNGHFSSMAMHPNGKVLITVSSSSQPKYSVK